MAFVFDASPTSATMNSYCTTSFADDYQSVKLNTVWAALTTANKEKLLAWASRQLNTLLWIGAKVSPTQPMQWPRKYVPIEGRYSDYYGTEEDAFEGTVYFGSTTVPTPIQECCSELAGILAGEDVTEDSGISDIQRVKVDVIEIQYKSTATQKWLSKSVRDLCYKYLANSSPNNAPTLRVG